nr:hypothetical protein [uncultured Butyrivibrio sp.]
MKKYYKVDNETLIEADKDVMSGKVTAYVHNGICTFDGAFHIIEMDDKPSIFENESMFTASLHKEYLHHEVFEGNVIYPRKVN